MFFIFSFIPLKHATKPSKHVKMKQICSRHYVIWWWIFTVFQFLSRAFTCKKKFRQFIWCVHVSERLSEYLYKRVSVCEFGCAMCAVRQGIVLLCGLSKYFHLFIFRFEVIYFAWKSKFHATSYNKSQQTISCAILWTTEWCLKLYITFSHSLTHSLNRQPPSIMFMTIV